jgi:hypothetical protein
MCFVRRNESNFLVHAIEKCFDKKREKIGDTKKEMFGLRIGIVPERRIVSPR